MKAKNIVVQALGQYSSAFAQQDLKSWSRDKYGSRFGFDLSNPQSRARISRASLATAPRRILERKPVFGAPDRIRICDLCLRRATLYPAELRVQNEPPMHLGICFEEYTDNPIQRKPSNKVQAKMNVTEINNVTKSHRRQ
jgi:hypothetical protein